MLITALGQNADEDNLRTYFGSSLQEMVCRVYSLESTRRDGSNGYKQHIIL